MLFSEYPYINFSDLNLSWIINLIKELKETVDGFGDWKTQHEEEYKQLKQLYDDVMSGNFPDSIKAAFNDWMRKNAVSIVGEMVKMVFFGLTYDGYFVAYIPDSWEDIIFNTTDYDIDITGIGYGHLVLSY